VEKHPDVTAVYNYFAGDPRQAWPNDVSLMIGELGLLGVLSSFRNQSYKAGKMLLSIFDKRIPSLSFIFILQPEG